jgi:polysaccharide biosynthesis/export protein
VVSLINFFNDFCFINQAVCSTKIVHIHRKELIIMMKNTCLLSFARTGFINSCFLIALLLLLFSSCSVSKQSQYFRNLPKDTTLTGTVVNKYESTIVVGDRLAISVSSLNPQEDAIFNGASVSAGATNMGGYLVQENGTIQLHRLGTIQVEGLTRRVLMKQLEKKLEAYTKDPLVQVSYLNHKVTVIGEVAKPQVYNMGDEQISIIDLLIQSGDALTSANRADITIIREEGNTRNIKHLNLEDNSIFTSPWYFVKPNDIVLVNADTNKYIKNERRNRLQSNISLTASLLSLALIILTNIIK